MIAIQMQMVPMNPMIDADRSCKPIVRAETVSAKQQNAAKLIIPSKKTARIPARSLASAPNAVIKRGTAVIIILANGVTYGIMYVSPVYAVSTVQRYIKVQMLE